MSNLPPLVSVPIESFEDRPINIKSCYIKLGPAKIIKISGRTNDFNESIKKYHNKGCEEVLLEIPDFIDAFGNIYLDFIKSQMIESITQEVVWPTGVPSGGPEFIVLRKLLWNTMREIDAICIQHERFELSRFLVHTAFYDLHQRDQTRDLFSQIYNLKPELFAFSAAVSCVSLILAHYCGINSPTHLIRISEAALMHKAGLVSLDHGCTHKSQKDFTQTETIAYQNHPEVGSQLLEKTDLQDIVIEIVRDHTDLNNKNVGLEPKIVGLAEMFVHLVLSNPSEPFPLETKDAFATMKEQIKDKGSLNILSQMEKCFESELELEHEAQT